MVNDFRNVKSIQLPSVEEILAKNPNAFKEMAESLAKTLEEFDEAEREAIKKYFVLSSPTIFLTEVLSWLSDDNSTNHYGEHVCSEDDEQPQSTLFHILSLHLDEDYQRGFKLHNHYYYAQMDYGMGEHFYIIKPAPKIDDKKVLTIDERLLHPYLVEGE